MIGRLNHVAIAVPDLAAAAAQYRDTLGAVVREPQDEPDHGVTVVFVALDRVAHRIHLVAAREVGNGAVQLMGTRDLFAVLLEYGPESVGKKLFADTGMPRMFEPHEFSRSMARDGSGLQSAVQRFFVESGRPFTLYVVLGSHLGRRAFMARRRLPRHHARHGDRDRRSG